MATGSKIMPSASADGDGILVTTASPIDGSDTLIHTAVTGTTDIDYVTIYAYNDHTAEVDLHLKWGDGSVSIKQTIPNKAGLYLVVADLPINDGNTIEASASTTSVIVLFTSVSRMDN